MKFISLILFVLTLLSCNDSNTVTISGTVTNPVDNRLIIGLINTQDTITIQSDGSYHVSFTLNNQHRVTMVNGRGWLGLYLLPGSNLEIDFDGKELEKYKFDNVSINGNDSEASKFLLAYRKGFSINRSSANSYNLSATEFDKKETRYIEDLNKNIDQFEVSNPSLKEFIELQRMEVRILQWQHYDYYARRFNASDQDTMPLLKKLEAYTNTIPLDNYRIFKESGNYRTFVIRQHAVSLNMQLKAEGLQDGTPEYTDRKIDLIKKLEVPQMIKDELGYTMIEVFPGFNKNIIVINKPDNASMEVVKKRYSEIITNENYIKAFENYLSGK